MRIWECIKRTIYTDVVNNRHMCHDHIVALWTGAWGWQDDDKDDLNVYMPDDLCMKDDEPNLMMMIQTKKDALYIDKEYDKFTSTQVMVICTLKTRPVWAIIFYWTVNQLWISSPIVRLKAYVTQRNFWPCTKILDKQKALECQKQQSYGQHELDEFVQRQVPRHTRVQGPIHGNVKGVWWTGS